MTAQRQESYGRRSNAVFCGRIALIAALAVLAPLAEATTSERVVANRFSGLAIEGFDPVAYFVTGQPVRGLPEFEASQSGAVWRFHNEGNRASFVAHPEISMAHGSAATTRPTSRAVSYLQAIPCSGWCRATGSICSVLKPIATRLSPILSGSWPGQGLAGRFSRKPSPDRIIDRPPTDRPRR